jgi:hypothetical protein
VPCSSVFSVITTAVVITLKTLKELGVADTRVARVIVASCVIDDLLTLVFFGLVVWVLSGGSFEPMDVVVTLAKVVSFFGLAVLLGRFAYPHFTLPFRSEGGKGFTLVLLVGIAAGLFAEAIGLTHDPGGLSGRLVLRGEGGAPEPGPDCGGSLLRDRLLVPRTDLLHVAGLLHHLRHQPFGCGVPDTAHRGGDRRSDRERGEHGAAHGVAGAGSPYRGCGHVRACRVGG